MTTAPDLDLRNIAEYREVAERRRDLREQRSRAQQEVRRLEAELRTAAAQREARVERSAIQAILAGREPDPVPDLDQQLAQARRRLELVSRAVREIELEEYTPTRARAVKMVSERYADQHYAAIVEVATAIEKLELAMEHECSIRRRLEAAGCWDANVIPRADLPIGPQIACWRQWVRYRYLERSTAQEHAA